MKGLSVKTKDKEGTLTNYGHRQTWLKYFTQFYTGAVGIDGKLSGVTVVFKVSQDLWHA